MSRTEGTSIRLGTLVVTSYVTPISDGPKDSFETEGLSSGREKETVKDEGDGQSCTPTSITGVSTFGVRFIMVDSFDVYLGTRDYHGTSGTWTESVVHGTFFCFEGKRLCTRYSYLDELICRCARSEYFTPFILINNTL